MEERTPHQHQPAVEHLNLQHSHRDTHQERPDLQKTHIEEMSNCKHAEEDTWHGQVQSAAMHVPLFSMASISLVRSGGAVSGGPNCSAKSGSTKPKQRTQYTEVQSNKLIMNTGEQSGCQLHCLLLKLHRGSSTAANSSFFRGSVTHV